MDRALISWNIPNWITVMLMAAGGYAILLAVKTIFVKTGPTQTGVAGGF